MLVLSPTPLGFISNYLVCYHVALLGTTYRGVVRHLLLYKRAHAGAAQGVVALAVGGVGCQDCGPKIEACTCKPSRF